MADLANDAAAVLDHAGAGPTVVVGFSMGGMIAQELAILHPDELSKLVRVATGAGGAEMKLEQALFAPLFPPDNADPTDAAVRELWASIAAPGFDESDPSVVDGIVASHHRQPTPRDVLNLQAGAIGQFDRSKDLGQVRVPTVIVHGTADPRSTHSCKPLGATAQRSVRRPRRDVAEVDDS